MDVVGSLVGEVLVLFNLVTKHPAGLQTFALKAKDKLVGSLSTEVNTGVSPYRF